MNKFNLSILVPVYTTYALLNTNTDIVSKTDWSTISNVILAFAVAISFVWISQIIRFREVSRIKFEVAVN